MRKKIINLLKQSARKPLGQKEFLNRLKLKQHEVGAAKILIREMIKSGDIISVKGKRLTRPKNPKTFEGKLSVTQKGFGFVITKDESEDIFIGRRSMSDAIHGDRVRVKIKDQSISRGLKGRIDKVLERGSDRFIGVTYKYRGKMFLAISPVSPDRGIRLIKASKDLAENQIVKAKVSDWGNAFNPIIAVLNTVIGQADDPLNDMKMILHKYDYDQSFPSKVMREVKEYSEKDIANEISNRLDLRDSICFTIDPVDAKDFDDAISIKKTKNGTELGIHIADVSHFVQSNSEIDNEAMYRGNSVYFTEGVVHMLPQALSADLCSLRPKVDRLAVSAIIQLDNGNSVIGVDIRPTVINSNARFTYREVQDVIDGKLKHKYNKELIQLKRLASALFNKRSKEGSIDFDIPEPIFDMGDRGIPHEIRPSERLLSHRIVEECMLLANQVVAINVPKELPKKFPFVFRVHAKPDSLDVERFGGLLKRLKLGVYVPDGDMSPNDFKNILRYVEDSPYRSLIETVALRTMSKAEYSIKNAGHFGLAFRHYTHFTSPIRRYPDLMVHRIIKMVCGQSFAPKAEWREMMGKAVKLSNASEIEAKNAEREYIKVKQLRWLSERIGATFEGIISGVVNFGIFVGLRSSMAEGLVHLDTLEDDEYSYDEDSYCLRGRKYKGEYRLGDTVTVRVLSVQFDKQRANFILENL